MTLRLPQARFGAATAAALLILVGCRDSATAPDRGPVTLNAYLADGQPLPAVAVCPAPAAGMEAWVAFGRGALVLNANDTFTWTFDIGSGYRSFTIAADGSKQYLMQSAEGGTHTITGTAARDANGDRVLTFREAMSSGTSLAGGGRLTASGATMTAVYECPHAPDATQHAFDIALK